MARIVIIGASEASRTQLSRLLVSSGHPVFRTCASDSSIRRTLSECEDGIVILCGGIPGSLTDALQADFGGSFRFLLIARPEHLAACESQAVFKLSYPCSGSAVIGAVEMLSQLHTMHLPRRTAGDRALIDRAKCLLMERKGISEPEAHRQMQQHAMHHHMKMTEVAEALLREASGGGINLG
ncbi:MAG: ANTAR domain-containing protein [Clostridia bacterium]|nr:ANTAR domain-containing protein [Clostridia bacterium]